MDNSRRSPDIQTEQFTAFWEEVGALSDAIRRCSSITVIERALRETTGPGDDWPQGGEYPNSSFTLAMVDMLRERGWTVSK